MMDLSERLIWPQIRERYPDQWVVLVEHDWDEIYLGTYKTARALACGGSRAEAIANARPALDAYDGYGCRFTGEIRGPMFELKQFKLDPYRTDTCHVHQRAEARPVSRTRA